MLRRSLPRRKLWWALCIWGLPGVRMERHRPYGPGCWWGYGLTSSQSHSWELLVCGAAQEAEEGKEESFWLICKVKTKNHPNTNPPLQTQPISIFLPFRNQCKWLNLQIFKVDQNKSRNCQWSTTVVPLSSGGEVFPSMFPLLGVIFEAASFHVRSQRLVFPRCLAFEKEKSHLIYWDTRPLVLTALQRSHCRSQWHDVQDIGSRECRICSEESLPWWYC